MFSFFVKKIFLRKSLFVLLLFVLIVLSSCLSFMTLRTVFSTLEGAYETAKINKPGFYIANMDPSQTPDVDNISDADIQKIYDYLDTHHKYAFFTDGYIVDLPNSEHMDVSVAFMNEAYDQLKGFTLDRGASLDYSYDLHSTEPVPVYVGKGLSKEYPIGSVFSLSVPGLERELQLKVQGVLAADVSHSNYYALDSKQYYNFSIIFPVNTVFLREASVALKLNALMDLIIADTNTDQLQDLGSVIQKSIDVKFNFYGQEENIAFYNEYFVSSMTFIAILSIVLLIVIVILAVWSSLSSVRIMIKEFTLCMFNTQKKNLPLRPIVASLR